MTEDERLELERDRDEWKRKATEATALLEAWVASWVADSTMVPIGDTRAFLQWDNPQDYAYGAAQDDSSRAPSPPIALPTEYDVNGFKVDPNEKCCPDCDEPAAPEPSADFSAYPMPTNARERWLAEKAIDEHVRAEAAESQLAAVLQVCVMAEESEYRGGSLHALRRIRSLLTPDPSPGAGQGEGEP